MATYAVVCFAQNPKTDAVTVETGLSLADAQAICRDPETSSTTATGPDAAERTRRMGGGWFYGYREE